jgi:hypothetical protein
MPEVSGFEGRKTKEACCHLGVVVYWSYEQNEPVMILAALLFFVCGVLILFMLGACATCVRSCRDPHARSREIRAFALSLVITDDEEIYEGP